jgi:hypothetical protein
MVREKEKKKRLFFGFVEEAIPTKRKGRWGLKNLFLFTKSFIEKNVWRLIQGTWMWV